MFGDYFIDFIALDKFVDGHQLPSFVEVTHYSKAESQVLWVKKIAWANFEWFWGNILE